LIQLVVLDTVLAAAAEVDLAGTINPAAPAASRRIGIGARHFAVDGPGGTGRSASDNNESVGEPELELLERGLELDVLARAAVDATHGQGRLIVVHGAAGIGKSRLLAQTENVALSSGMRVLRARGSELERGFGFGLVQQLFEVALSRENHPEELLAGPAAQAAVVLSEPGRPGDDRVAPAGDFPVLHGLYWLTVNLSNLAPVAVICDDLHWSDEASLRFLAYLLPRLNDLPVLVVVALRPNEPGGPLELIDLIVGDPYAESLTLAPLTIAASQRLLTDAFAAPAESEFVAACHEVTRGNPLLLKELAAAARARGIAPDAASASSVLKMGADFLGQRIRLWLRRLPSDCQTLARSVAVLGNTSLAGAAQLAGVSGAAATQALDRLCQANIMAGGEEGPIGKVDFVHPLVRAAVYDSLSLTARSELHRAAADQLAADGAPVERVANHLLRTSLGGTVPVVSTLRRAAIEAVRRGSPDNAHRYLERCLAEPLPVAERLSVLRQAASAARFTDASACIARNREALAATTDRRDKAVIGIEIAWDLLGSGQMVEAADVLFEAIELLPEAEKDLRSAGYAALVNARLFTPGRPDLITFAEQLRERPAERSEGGVSLDGLLAMHETFACEPAAVARARRALETPPPRDSSWHLRNPRWAPWHVLLAADAPGVMEHIDTALARAQQRGSSTAVSLVSIFRALAWHLRGALHEARADAAQAMSLVETTNSHFGRSFVGAFLASTYVELGQLAQAQRTLRWIAAVFPDFRQAPASMLVLNAEAQVLSALGDHEGALSSARAAGVRFDEVGGLNPALVPWRSRASFALLHLGRLAEARALAQAELDLARRWGAPTGLGRALRALARTEVKNTFQRPILEEATAVLAGSPAQLEYGKALAQLGATLRRLNHPADARRQLVAALNIAERSDAQPLIRQINVELRAAGGRSRRARQTGPDALTPSEMRVAQMAAEGDTNRQIAQTLFITPKTVEVHLRNVFRKLNLKSRKDIGEALPPRE
jgi:DNA-binding CsgD family transcriptional regulator